MQDFYRRLANSVWFISNAIGDKDFPPVTADVLQAGFAYGFSDAVVEIVYKEIPTPDALLTPEQQEATKAAPAEDVPFGPSSEEKG